MQPTPAQLTQLTQLHQSLLAAYTDAELRAMLHTQLDTELEHIVPVVDKNLREITEFSVRVYAAEPDGLARLARAAQPNRFSSGMAHGEERRFT